VSVQFIGGKPGGGKTLLAVRIILDELRKSDRVVVTNVSLKLGEIAGYFNEQGWSYNAEWLRDRVVILEDEQLVEFFRFRYPGVVLPVVGDKTDYTKVKDKGVLYVLDEVHIPFNSRRWQDTGPKVIYYLSQHRKLGDDVVLISQAIQNVDKQMRSMAQDFTYVRNLSKEQHGLFRLPAVFVRRVFLELPTGPNVKAIQTGTFKLDVSGVGRCYDTAAGVGIVGRAGADTHHKSKGLHWAWYLGCLAAIIFGLVRYTPGFVEWITTGGRNRALASSHSKPVSSEQVRSVSGTNFDSSPAHAASLPQRINVATNDVEMTGYALLNGSYRVFLSDGTSATSGDGHLQFICPNYCDIDGVRYRITKGPRHRM